MRLGDLNALTGKLKNGLGNAKNAGKEDYAKIFEVFIDWVSREPTISAVPVVRCRECKYHKPIDYCEKHAQTGWFDDDFCSRGQRKEN